MAIVYLDKIKSGIPTTIIEGKDVDSIILVDPDPSTPPFFKVNKLILDTSTNIITVHDSSGNPTTTFSIDASVVEEALDAVKLDVEANKNEAEKAHNLATSAQTEAALNTANLAALDVTVAHNTTKIVEHTVHLDTLSVDMATVKHSARAANLTADEALAKANNNIAAIAALDAEADGIAADVVNNRISIEGLSASLDITDENVGVLSGQIADLGPRVEANELGIAELDTEYVGLLSDIERIDAEIAAIEAETVLRNNTNISVKDISTSTGNFNLSDPNRVIDRYDFQINGLSEMSMTGDYIDLYTKPITNLGTGGDLDTNAANIGDVKRISSDTNPDLSNYVEKMSDAPLKSIEMEFGAIGSTADEGLVLEGDTLYAKSVSGYEHFFIEDGKFNVKSKLIQNLRDGVDVKDAVTKGQLDTVDTKATAADTLSKSNQTSITNLSQTVGEHSTQISNNASAISNKADQSDLTEVKATANEADALSKVNSSRLNTVDTEIIDLQSGVTNATNLATNAQTSVDTLSVTVASNSAQISTNTKNIGDQSALLDSVSDVANQADTLAKSNQSAITGLNNAVDNNTSAISSNTSEIANVKTTANAADALSKSNQTALGSKASQSELNTVAGIASAADSRSQSNEAKLAGKVGINSDAEVNSLVNVSGNYNSTDNFDLKVNGTNVLSATSSALYAKKNLVMQDGKLITDLGDAVADKDAMNKQSVEAITNALSLRIDDISAGTGDESDYVTVHGFDKLISEDGDNINDLLGTLDGDSECHIMFNAIRKARPVVNTQAAEWVMYAYVNANHNIWKFCPTTGIERKDGVVCITHTSNVGTNVKITTESTILSKQMYYNFGTGSNGRRNDWQVWEPTKIGHEGYNYGQILRHSDIIWTPSSDPRTNMQRIRDAMPNNSMWIGWHNPNAENTFRLVFHGNTSTIESTSGLVVLFKRGGTSSTGGFYINTASTSPEGWTRVYIGASNAWAAFDKQNNRSTGTFFTGVESVTIPHLEDREDLKTMIIDTTQNLLGTYLTDADGTYNSVGKYGVGWDGNWTADWAYHNAYLNPTTSVYIAFDYSVMQWRKFPVSKSHTQIGQPAVQSSIALLGERSLFPTDPSVTVELGDIEAVPHVSAEVEEVYDHITKESTLSFGGGKMWGYILGGGVPDVTPPEYPDGIDPVEEGGNE